MQTELKPCENEGCDGTIMPDRHDGRSYTKKDVIIFIDKDIVIPRCNKCKAYYHSNKLMTFIDGVLEYEYNRHRDLIQAAFERDKLRA